jgi:hypothetical protein
VGGGPTPDSNQVSLESNTRYALRLLNGARSNRALFASGEAQKPTVNYLPTDEPRYQARRVLAWLLDDDQPEASLRYRAARVSPLHGATSQKSVAREMKHLASSLKPNETALVYFTGHGSPGSKRALGRAQEDFENNTFALWGGGELSVREFAPLLQAISPQNPVVLVMVQCYSGGFFNAFFQGGDPQKPWLNRDWCGFFAAIKEKQASGCTPEINERNYHDFSTHFFAALSGRTRYGQAVSNADYDRNGAVSMLEAYAYANIHDLSADVPTCTSDEFLRHALPDDSGAWARAPYSQVLAGASPWQKALLNTLSSRLKLAGQTRSAQALRLIEEAQRGEEEREEDFEFGWPPAMSRSYDNLLAQLKRRFPALVKSPATASPRTREAALKYLLARPSQVQVLGRGLDNFNRSMSQAEVREAMAWRFLRAARTVTLQKRLAQSGTSEQKAVFSRLRASESRNPLK